MKKLLKSILIMSILPLSACSISDKQKEGDLVTWQVTPQLIIKTELGLQWEMIAKSPNSPLINTYSKYVGVFPLEYKPKKYDQLTIDGTNKIIDSKNSNYKGHELTFDLALNNALFQPNDYIISIGDVMVHEDQIRVEIKNNVDNSIKIIPDNEIRTGKYVADLSNKSNLECYEFEKNVTSSNPPHSYFIYRCLGKPKDTSIPNVSFKLMSFDDDQLIASYNSEKLGINVRWRVDKKHISEWENIHTNIWNLINTWNVSPKI